MEAAQPQAVAMSMYLLDTNICIYALNRRPPEVLDRLIDAGRDRVGISTVTAAELAFGAAKSARPRTRVTVEAFLATMPVFDWGGDAVWRYAEIRFALEKTGRRIGERDLLIAAHALALDRTVVTNDEGEFSRVPGLRCENWVAP
jgi:tRNA(fMet)-specific endonuclease VapC